MEINVSGATWNDLSQASRAMVLVPNTGSLSGGGGGGGVSKLNFGSSPCILIFQQCLHLVCEWWKLMT
jgi:hypothetical protein